MTRSQQPVSSFGSELLATLRQGANRELRIKFDDRKLAVRFGQRINALRAAMKREQHADWQQLYRCGVHHDTHDPTILVIAPKDSEFRSALLAAGVDVAAPPPVTDVHIPTPAPGEPIDPADSFLATLIDATTVPSRSESTAEGTEIADEGGKTR